MAISCKQCGRTAVQMCGRTDCWATETNIELENTRRAKEVAKAGGNEGKAAVAAFESNFIVVSDWAEKIGAQRPLDRDVIKRMGRETVRAAEVYAAIARSL